MPLSWPPIVARAAEIVTETEARTGVRLTLRALFYRLVSEELIPNLPKRYDYLSSVTAQARREGRFPALSDPTRWIARPLWFDDPDEARAWLADRYRRDRTEGQDFAVYLGIEKHALAPYLESWFSDRGIPVLALGGHTSQTFVEEVAEDAVRDGRKAVLLYAGDFDPSGEDIHRDFLARTGCFDEVERVALSAEQVLEYDLPPQMGKATDSRASAFVKKHGELVQVELDALDLDVLRGLFEDALEPFWDEAAYQEVLAEEEVERRTL